MTKRIGYICGSGDTFIASIMAHLAEVGFETVLLESWPDSRVDLVWCEWCDQNAVRVTRVPKTAPIIVRLHSFEAFTDFPAKVDWSKVDHLIFVTKHVRDYVLSEFKIEGPKIHVIPNGVNFNLFSIPAEKEYGRKIGWVGGISHKKGPDIFLEVVRDVCSQFPDAEFHVAGELQDRRWGALFDDAFRADGIAERVRFHGAIPAAEMPAFYRGVDFILSTSPWESFQYSVAEGIASGCIPLVRAWRGAAATYPMADVWKSAHEVSAIIGEARPYDVAKIARSRRAALKELYGSNARLADVTDLVRRALNKPAQGPTVSVCMIVKGEDPRIRAAIESVIDHVDEVVCCVDTRSGDQALKVVGDLKCRVKAWTPPLYGDGIDFGKARNGAAALATKDWIFVLDSDEVVENAALIKPMVWEADRKGYDAMAVHINCYTDMGLTEEAKDVRAYKRREGVQYHYPVHNQLRGYDRVLGVEIILRSTYVGGLQQRCDRSIPQLMRMWTEVNNGVFAEAETPEQVEAARKHAAFFLCRMAMAGGNLDDVEKWAEVVEEICPKEQFASPAWKWHMLVALRKRGPAAGIEIGLKALAIHPEHVDVLHAMVAAYLVQWAAAAQDPENMPGTPMASRQYVGNIEQAINLLGLPVNVNMKGGGA